MRPIVFRLGPFEVRSYGLLLAISFLLGIALAVRRGRARGLDPNAILDLSVIIVISSIVGARVFYVLFHLEQFRGRWLDIINPFQSTGQVGIAGLTLLGGMLLSILAGFTYMAVKKLPALKLADSLVPSVALGTFLTRIGCFLNGCCYGKPTPVPWAVVFPSDSPAGVVYPDVPIHPSQLYSSLYGLLLFGLLLWADRRKPYDGFVFYLFLIGEGVARFLVDFTRYYEDSMVLVHLGKTSLSVNQGISLAFIALGLVLMVFRLRKVPSVALKESA